jgi:hypothetical protein
MSRNFKGTGQARMSLNKGILTRDEPDKDKKG